MPRRTEVEPDELAVDEAKVRQAQKLLVDGLTATRLAHTFRSLSDPCCVRIVSALASGEMCVCNVAAVIGVGDSATAQELRALREANVVEYRKVDGEALYRLKSPHIGTLFSEGLRHASGT